jgi:hypothetical protein
LPVVRCADSTPEVVTRAHEEAVRLYDRDGFDGAVRRHRFALEKHTFTPRIGEIIATVQAMAGVCLTARCQKQK